MDLVLPYRPNRLTPAKHQAEESPAANEYDFLSKKLKAEEILAAMEADLPSDVKSEDGLLLKNQKDEETPAADGDDLSSDEESDDEDDWSSQYEPDSPEETPNEEHIVEEEPNAYSESLKRQFRPIDFSDTVYEGVFADEEEKRNYRLYYEEYFESEGFDVEHFSNKVLGGLRRLALDKDDRNYIEGTVTRDCSKSVEAAIKYTNLRNNWNLKLERIIKCNCVMGSRYYATFDARDKDTGVTRTYQTQVGRDHWTGKTTIFRFRLKPEHYPDPYSEV